MKSTTYYKYNIKFKPCMHKITWTCSYNRRISSDLENLCRVLISLSAPK